MNFENKSLVSVIIPVYNDEKFICRCVTSILKQTYNHIEIILVDDGSTDMSASICDKLALGNSNIHVFHKSNGGAATARNFGIENAHGDYIVFVDGDDFISSIFIERLLYLKEKYHTKIAQCNFERGDKNAFSKKCDSIKVTYLDDYKMYETRFVNSTVWGKLFDAEILKELKFPEHFINEDEFYTYKALYSSGKIVLTNEIMYYYYKNHESVMNKKRIYIPLDIENAFEERINFFKSKNENKAMIISVKEYCIRLIILYSKCKTCSENENDKTEILNLFKSEYSNIKESSLINRNDKILLYIFDIMPDFVAEALKLLGKV